MTPSDVVVVVGEPERGGGGGSWLLITLMVLVLLAGGLGLWYGLSSRSGPGPVPTSSTEPVSSPTASPTPSPTPTPTPTPPPTEEPPSGIGIPVRDGDFEFVVQSVECGLESFESEIADGQFCAVQIMVTNTDRGAFSTHVFPTRAQRAYDADGNSYATKIWSGPSTYLAGYINIGGERSITGTVVFELPGDAVLVRVELREDDRSPGVTVEVC